MNFYISPSNQPNNGYVIGNTNEKAQMEKVAKQVVELLKGYNCTPILASLDLTIKKSERPKEAKDKDADFYLAIHSNAAGTKPPCNATGAVAMYHPKSEKAKELAAELVKNLNAACPVKSNRAASVINGMLAFDGAGYGEIRSPMEYGIPTVLVETNFHDNPVTAQWIIDNTKAIAQAIVSAMAQTFQLKPKNSTSTAVTTTPYEATAIVSDPDAPLNVRKGPGVDYGVIGGFPNGTKVEITGKCSNGWYQINYGGSIGYVNGVLLTNFKQAIYKVQVGAFNNKEYAEAQANKLKKDGYNDAYIVRQ